LEVAIAHYEKQMESSLLADLEYTRLVNSRDAFIQSHRKFKELMDVYFPQPTDE
jgi:hypothetical protein